MARLHKTFIGVLATAFACLSPTDGCGCSPPHYAGSDVVTVTGGPLRFGGGGPVDSVRVDVPLPVP